MRIVEHLLQLIDRCPQAAAGESQYAAFKGNCNEADGGNAASRMSDTPDWYSAVDRTGEEEDELERIQTHFLIGGSYQYASSHVNAGIDLLISSISTWTIVNNSFKPRLYAQSGASAFNTGDTSRRLVNGQTEKRPPYGFDSSQQQPIIGSSGSQRNKGMMMHREITGMHQLSLDPSQQSVSTASLRSAAKPINPLHAYPSHFFNDSTPESNLAVNRSFGHHNTAVKPPLSPMQGVLADQIVHATALPRVLSASLKIKDIPRSATTYRPMCHGTSFDGASESFQAGNASETFNG